MRQRDFALPRGGRHAHIHTHEMVASWDLDVVEELRLIPMLGDLPREAIAELAAAAVQRRVPAGTTLVQQGTPAPAFEVLARGAVKIVRTTRHGAGQSIVVLDVMRAPAVLGGESMFDGLPASASAITLRASHLIDLDRRVVLKAASQHPPLTRALFAHLAQLVRRHVRRIDEVASGPVDDRVRHLLESLAHEHGTPFGQGRFIAIPLRRRDIACMVNATTETVSRLLARFEREGMARSTRDGIWWKATSAGSRPPPRDSDRPAAAEEPGDALAAPRGIRGGR